MAVWFGPFFPPTCAHLVLASRYVATPFFTGKLEIGRVCENYFGRPKCQADCLTVERLFIFIDLIRSVSQFGFRVVPHKAVAEVSQIDKNRKPMKEVGCCESWIRERAAASRLMIDRWLEFCFLVWLQW